MTVTENIAEKQRALLALKQMRAKLDQYEAARNEPIAVVGMACRFPAAPDIAAFWQLLHTGRDGIGEVPASRWDVNAFYDPEPGKPGKMSTRWGGFLDDVDQFDAEFFGISPREAISLDPQQRLLLEVVWEALEHAGQAPLDLMGQAVGVFIGLCNIDYVNVARRMGDITRMDAYFGSGNAFSTASGRISYILGLTGPSMTIDTACSSSLVALHLACQSLRAEECRAALVGGVNLILSPEGTINFSQAHMLSPVGRCQTFDAAADGYVRSEGCGMVMLKRLRDAERAGDRILAIIRGSAINQDGHSSGLTAPNGPAQVRVIQQALGAAGLNPADVSYVEAHGTGTQLGDPIEFKALGDAYSPGRTESLLVGAVKSNIGHLEAAAGMAGLIKVVLAMQHGCLPPNLHFRQLSPYLIQPQPAMRIPTAPTPWNTGNGRRIAGLSGFGFSGTNVHVILEDYRPAPQKNDSGGVETARHLRRTEELLILSARDENALKSLAHNYAAAIEANPDISLADMAHTAACGRSHFRQRLAIGAATRDDARSALLDFGQGQANSGKSWSGAAQRGAPPRIAFLFTGQASQYCGMGRELFDTSPLFRDILTECDAKLQAELGQSIIPILYPPTGSETGPTAQLLDQTRFTQPILFVLEVALARLWQAWGIQPALVLGHSVGEFAAAVIAGVMSLDDGLRLIAARGRLIQAIPAGGAMATIFAGLEQVQELIKPYAGEISLAALNGPEHTVIAGRQDKIAAILAVCQASGISTRELTVSHAFHSQLMEPALAPFEALAGSVPLASPQVRFISTLTGNLVRDELVRADYWRRHIREPVRFAEAVAKLGDQKCDVVVEIGPQPVLIGLMRQIPGIDQNMLMLPSLRRGRGDWAQLEESLGNLFVRGGTIDWAGWNRDYPVHKVALPSYPFQRQSFWLPVQRGGSDSSLPLAAAGVPAQARPVASPAWTELDHPLLARRFRSPLSEQLFEIQFRSALATTMTEHKVYDLAILPGAASLELALSAAAVIFGKKPIRLSEVSLERPILLDAIEERLVQLVWSKHGPDSASFRLVSSPQLVESENSPVWTDHVLGKVEIIHPPLGRDDQPALSEVRARCPEVVEQELIYQKYRELGMHYGPAFQRLKRIYRGVGEALGQLDLPAQYQAEQSGCWLHPALLDACFQVAGAVMAESDARTNLVYLPALLESVELWPRAHDIRWSRAVLTSASNRDSLHLDFTFYDDGGECLGTIRQFHFQKVTPALLAKNRPSQPRDWFYREEWRPRVKADLGGNESLLANLLTQQLNADQTVLTDNQALLAYPTLQRELDLIALEYIGLALLELGWQPLPGQRFEIAELLARFRIVARYERLFRRMLLALTEVGWLELTNERITVIQPWSTALAPHSRFAPLLETFPAHQTELTLLQRCAPHLAKILQGKRDPLMLIFPLGMSHDIEQLYSTAPLAACLNQALARAVAGIVASPNHPSDWQILEIGGGTGGTTEAVLQAVPAERVRYLYTDLRPVVIGKAQKRLKGYAAVECERLDISQSPAEQGFRRHTFDIVIASQSIYTAPSIRAALANIQYLLKPGGFLLLHEGITPLRWEDLVLGLIDEWWNFRDSDLRLNHPFLSFEQWQNLLPAAGFASVQVFPAEAARGTFPRALLLSQSAALKLSTADAMPQDHTWLILGDSTGVGAELVQFLRDRRESLALVTPGSDFHKIGDDGYELDPLQPADFDRLLAELSDPARPIEIFHLWSLDWPTGDDIHADDLALAKGQGGAALLHLLQALGRAKLTEKARLRLVVRGGNALAEGGLVSPLSALVWGLGKVIALEYPELHCQLIDLDPASSAVTMSQQLLDESTLVEAAEPQLLWRAGTAFVSRLTQISALPASSGQIIPEATYLISGGMGGIGRLVAGQLIEQGARSLVLLGRRALADDARQQLTEWQAQGVAVRYATTDVADFAALSRLFEEMAATLPPLRGVIHAAAVIEDGLLLNQDWPRFERVFAPKVDGAWNLHCLTRTMSLDFFVLFSSATSLLGSPGQANYVAANAFLDALAHFRRQANLPALAIDWGAWGQVGAAAARDFDARVAGTGMAVLEPAEGLAVLADLLFSPLVRVGVMPVDWGKLLRQFPGQNVPLFFEDFSRQTRREGTQETEESTSGDWLDIIRSIPAGDEARKFGLIELMQTLASKVLRRRDQEGIDPHQPLNELGLDSLMAVELKNSLQSHLNLVIPAAALFEHRTLAALAGYLVEKLEPSAVTDSALVESADPSGISGDVLRRDRQLPADILSGLSPQAPTNSPKTCLLTGATGHLGGYLLAELLRRTDFGIACLVRARDIEEGQSRLEQKLKEIQAWDETYRARLRPIVGDLTQPHFGLGSAEYRELAESIDIIYHNAATVNFVQPYQALKGVTVGGTHEIIRLAGLHRLKPIHFISSVAVFGSRFYLGYEEIPEDEDTSDGDGFPMGYSQSKWVTEQLMVAARARGIPVSIYRPSLISGHTTTGDCKLDDLLPLCIQGFVAYGYAPEIHNQFIDFVPVDYVSQAVIALSLNSANLGRAFNLVHPRPWRWNELIEQIKARGYPLECLDYRAWIERLRQTSERGGIVSLLPFFERMPEELFTLPRVCFQNTTAGLAGSGIECRSPADLLDVYFHYFLKIGWIPAPR